MVLTDVQAKNAKATEKDLWLSDENGLRLLVKTNGRKYWGEQHAADFNAQDLQLAQ